MFLSNRAETIIIKRVTMSEQYYFKVNGMKCDGCVSNVEKAINKLPGIEAVEVDLETAMAVVKGAASAESIGAAIDQAGFNAILIPG